MGSKRWSARVLAVGLAVSLAAAACGDDKGGSSDNATGSSTTGAATSSSTSLTPKKGGVLTVGQYTPAPGLDPAKLAGGGTVGGNEQAALYDTLLRYNPQTEKAEPRTAESMTSNADFSEWTMKLRSGIKFTDGNPYDANAVKFVLDRQMKEGNSSPRGQLTSFLDTITVVDDLTLKFKLKNGWAGFPYVFTGVAGLIYSPAAFQKAGGADKFNVAPGDAGAGPFKLKSYKPGEIMEFERNPSYWGGDVYLDGLAFRYYNGAAATYDAIKRGELQAGFIRDPAVMAQVKTDKYGSVDMPAIAGNMINMNSGVVVTCNGGKPDPICAGKTDGEKVPTKTATSNINVRKAVAAAVDPEVINQRVYSGKLLVSSAPFAYSPWDPKVPGVKYDQNEAKRLIQQAKTEGWDGKIRVLAGNDPVATAWAEAVRAQLAAVGMDVAVDTTKVTADVVTQVLVKNDYDLVTWAYGLADESDANYLQLVGTFNSKNPRYGYGNAELDAAIDLLRVADSNQKRTDAYRKITEIWLRDMPALVTGAVPQAMVHSPKVHDILRSGSAITLFAKAWTE